MEEELISKKELLEMTDISYGQLYRWKRKGLIPEDWFIKKASYTGQETFFPKLKVLSRIEKIKNMKEDVSLDELADVFTPTLSGVTMGADELIVRGLATEDILRLFRELSGIEDEQLGYNDMLMLFILRKLIESGDIGREEGRILLEVLRGACAGFGLEGAMLVLTRKLGVFTCMAVKPSGSVIVDQGSKIISRVHVDVIIEEMKLKML